MRAIFLSILIIVFVSNKNEAQSNNDSSNNFTTIISGSHKITSYKDGSKEDVDTITGWYKSWFPTGILEMEGKISNNGKKYRDSVWKYYNELGLLALQETYSKNGKINSLKINYFINNNPMDKTYEYFEGDYKDKTSFKFHKINTLFYMNGQAAAERHFVNDKIIEEKCWDSLGTPKPISYIDSIKTL